MSCRRMSKKNVLKKTHVETSNGLYLQWFLRFTKICLLIPS